MGAKNYRELRFWQLAHELRRRMYAITKRDSVVRDLEYCRSARKTTGQACRSIAEGYGRYGHAQFAQYVDVALASLLEAEDHLDEALEADYITQEEHTELNDLAEHARACGLRLLRHLSPEHETLKSGRRSHRPTRRS